MMFYAKLILDMYKDQSYGLPFYMINPQKVCYPCSQTYYLQYQLCAGLVPYLSYTSYFPTVCSDNCWNLICDNFCVKIMTYQFQRL